MWWQRIPRVGAAGVAVVVVVTAGCGGASPSPVAGEHPRSAPAPDLQPAMARTERRRPPHFRATVAVPTVQVFERPDETSRVTHEFPRYAEHGVPQTFLVEEKRRYGMGSAWVRVLLPVRPAGTTGWVRKADVEVDGLRHELVVDMSALELHVLKDHRRIRTYPIGIGTAETPTPGGRYYVRDVIQLTDPTSAYGPYALGLSGFSDVLSYWRGGGIIGIHGTDQPDSIGTRASHGCIRMRNGDVTELVEVIRLGTPVKVLA